MSACIIMPSVTGAAACSQPGRARSPHEVHMCGIITFARGKRCLIQTGDGIVTVPCVLEGSHPRRTRAAVAAVRAAGCAHGVPVAAARPMKTDKLLGCPKCRWLKNGCGACRERPTMERPSLRWKPSEGRFQDVRSLRTHRCASLDVEGFRVQRSTFICNVLDV